MSSVKFARNKTAKEALESKDKDTIYFTTDDSSIVMGGVAYGKETISEEKKDYLDKIYEDYQESLFTVKSYPSTNLVNLGTEVTITVIVKENGIPCSADEKITADSFLTGCEFSEITPGTYTTKVRMNTPGVFSSKITVIYSGMTKKSEVQVSCYGNILYGWSPSEVITSVSDLRDGSNSGPCSIADGEFRFSNSDVGYYYVLIPEGTKLSSSLSCTNPYGIENGIPVFFIKQSAPVLTGYTTFRNSDKQAISTHIINFN